MRRQPRNVLIPLWPVAAIFTLCQGPASPAGGLALFSIPAVAEESEVRFAVRSLSLTVASGSCWGGWAGHLPVPHTDGLPNHGFERIATPDNLTKACYAVIPQRARLPVSRLAILGHLPPTTTHNKWPPRQMSLIPDVPTQTRTGLWSSHLWGGKTIINLPRVNVQ